ncbi:hypothetical protein DSO57_1033862 [Entomophthora muscae]|uniref:Uncharacterized protein n=1 Tax=Entomophthora muscae TaxID=34485 RepID=A0ACC2TAN6_9FUNG|nr:hypothetical protein DSO57_1033862 [Entomophthora muscae]
MEPPVTSKPMSASTTKLPLDHTNKLFGIVYLTLMGVIDTIVLPPLVCGCGWSISANPLVGPAHSVRNLPVSKR